MRTYVISLKRTPERSRYFTEHNKSLTDFEFFDAIDGNLVAADPASHRDSFEPDLRYSNGALGCALSHKALWQLAASNDAPITVCEDDAILHPDFAAHRARIIESLGSEWDLVQWGWNFDAPLVAEILPLLSPCLLQLDQNCLRAVWQGYMANEVRPTVMRLAASFGLPCYSISPKGARKFLEGCFPIRNFDFSLPMTGNKLPNYGIDVAMNPVYPGSESFLTFPPLAISLNEQSTSTIQN